MKTSIAFSANLASGTVAAATGVATNVAVADLNTMSTNDLVLQATATNSANIQTKNNRIYVRYAFAQTDESANISRLSPTGVLEVHIPTVASGIRITSTDKITARGRFLHAWIDHEEFSATVTLTLVAVW